MCRLRILALFVVCSVPLTAGSTCALPLALQTSTWFYWSTVQQKNFSLTFGPSTMSGFTLTGLGTQISTYDCISNVDNIFVFRNTYPFSDRGKNRYLFLCMRLTQVSHNLFYFFLLSDIESSYQINPFERVFYPPYDQIPPDTDPTCNFCNYTTAPDSNDVRILQRMGSYDTLSNVTGPCLPCQKTQAECDFTCKCTAQEVDSLYARRNFEYIATVRNGDDFIPKNPPVGYKFAVIKVISTCLGETPYDNLARLNTVDPAFSGSTCPNAFAHLQVGETYVFFGMLKFIEGRRSFVVDQCTPPAKTPYRTCPVPKG